MERARRETGVHTSTAGRRTGFLLEIATGQLEIPLTTSPSAGRFTISPIAAAGDPDKTRPPRRAEPSRAEPSWIRSDGRRSQGTCCRQNR